MSLLYTFGVHKHIQKYVQCKLSQQYILSADCGRLLYKCTQSGRVKHVCLRIVILCDTIDREKKTELFTLYSFLLFIQASQQKQKSIRSSGNPNFSRNTYCSSKWLTKITVFFLLLFITQSTWINYYNLYVRKIIYIFIFILCSSLFSSDFVHRWNVDDRIFIRRSETYIINVILIVDNKWSRISRSPRCTYDYNVMWIGFIHLNGTTHVLVRETIQN